MNAFQKIYQHFLKRFFLTQGRGPGTPAEWMEIQDQAVRHLNKTKGAPSIKKDPFQGFTPKIVGKEEEKIGIEELLKGPVKSSGIKGDRIWDFSQKSEVIPFPDKGIRSLMEKGDVTVGKAPKTTKETLKTKKDRGILLRDADEDILRIKRENKEAIERFKEKMDKGDYGEGPDKFQFGGIARAGFPFGGLALKAIRDAWRANKTWGVGGPPYKPGATSFDVKDITKRLYGTEMGLPDIRKMSRHPAMSGIDKFDFEKFNKTWKNLKAGVLKEKMMERKLEAKSMISAAEKTMKEAIKEGGNVDMAKRMTDQMIRQSKESLKEVREGLKEIEIYKGMLQKQGRSVHYAGGIAPLVGEPSYAADFYDDRTPMAGGSIVKGGKWFLNNLRRALNDIEADKGFKNLTPERKEGLTSEIKNLIKSVEGGGPIPDEMIQTIRHDPKFAEISKTRSTDPDLYEFEDLILNYGKKGDVVDEQVKILEQMDVTNRRPNYLGGRIEYAGGGKAGLPAITQGRPQGPAMQQPQMPGGPQPTGIPGGTIVAQNQMQQSPWMGPQMQQGMGGMPRPQPGGMPRPMAAGGGRIGFGLGGINKGRRAFMKWLAGITAGGVAAGTGLLKLGKAAKAFLKSQNLLLTFLLKIFQECQCGSNLLWLELLKKETMLLKNMQ